MKELSLKEKLGITSFKDFMIINLGLLLLAAGIHFFRNPNKFATGGISGLSIVLTYFFPDIPMGTIMLLLNIVLLILALVLLGSGLFVKTVYGSLMLSALVVLFERFFPMTAPLTDNKLMELIYSVFIPGVGLAIVFQTGATTGGTDIIAKIISKYFKLKISISLFLADVLIVLGATWVFGIENGLYSFMGLMLSTYVVDGFLENLQIKKIITIISDNSAEIEDYICSTINRGATVHRAWGAYNKEEKFVITTVVNRGQARKLQDYLKEHDPHAFITITSSSNIIGTGFKKFE
jgi:uncharacterized membrane-anchored protein YitT (DUF2179 family)